MQKKSPFIYITNLVLLSFLITIAFISNTTLKTKTSRTTNAFEITSPSSTPTPTPTVVAQNN